eukprot:jgi/Picre1/34346/NNA_001818.t1
MSDWRGSLGGVLPKVHTLDALIEVLPELEKYVKNGGVGQRQESSSQGAEGGLERTESEEKEYEYALSVELMRKEKQENRVLLDSLKKAKESDTGSLYENEISLLRHSIHEKQELINRMHEKCISLAAKNDELELKVKDQQDHTKEARERLFWEAKSIEEDIMNIQEDKMCALQRLHQYQLLYTRTKEDRDDAELKMQKTKDLVEKGREDLFTMKEFQNKAQHAEEQAQKELNLAVAKLEASRKFWRSSLEKKKRQVASLISRYERSKAERLRRAEDEDKRAEAERAVQESERRIISSQKKALEETAQKRKIRREQWRLVCAAAGLNGEASVADVIKAYHALQELHASLKQKSDQNVVTENRDEGDVSSSVETNSPQADTNGLAQLIKVSDTKEASTSQIPTAESSPKSQWHNSHAAELLGGKDIMEQNAGIRKEVSTDYDESKPVLQREDIKSRSTKLKAKLDKQRWMKKI